MKAELNDDVKRFAELIHDRLSCDNPVGVRGIDRWKTERREWVYGQLVAAAGRLFGEIHSPVRRKRAVNEACEVATYALILAVQHGLEPSESYRRPPAVNGTVDRALDEVGLLREKLTEIEGLLKREHIHAYGSWTDRLTWLENNNQRLLATIRQLLDKLQAQHETCLYSEGSTLQWCKLLKGHDGPHVYNQLPPGTYVITPEKP